MCASCMAEMEFVVEGEVLPGFFLERAKKDYDYIKAGDYGLIICNDPSFVFSITPVENPDFDNEDAEINWDWLRMADEFEQQLGDSCRHLKDVWRLIDACYKSGYTDEQGNWDMWLFNYLGKKLKEQTCLTTSGETTE